MSEFLIKLLADWLVIIIAVVGAVGFIVLTRKDRYQMAARGVVFGLTALLFAKIASLLYQGERPFVVLGEAPKAAFLNNPGFPSDHALLVFVVAVVIWVSTKNKPLSIALFICSVLVCIGRVLALVHSPADVFGAFVCVAAAAIVVYGRRLFTAKIG